MVQLTTGSVTITTTVSAVGGYHGVAVGSTTIEMDVDGKSTIILVETSQFALLADSQYEPDARASQAARLTLGTKPAEFEFTSQLAALALSQITAKHEFVSELAQEVLVQGDVVDQVSQLAQLVLVRSNPDQRKLRAFPFWLDGHWLYVLHLGNLTTLVYDTLTSKWSEWQTQNYNNWKAGYAVNWNGDIVAGAIDGNMLYNVDADISYDDTPATPIVSVVTGGYPTRLRVSIACDEIMATTSVGFTSGGVSTLQLRTSDDSGISWQDWGAQDFSAATPQMEVSWRSLGNISAPGRIFELTDIGAAARINSIEMYSRDVQDA